MYSLNQESCKFNEIIRKSILIEDGNPARYRLQTRTDNLDQSDSYKKMIFGEQDKNKPHKTVLMVGETGSGKTTLINVMINYMLGVQREDKVWFEITDDQRDQTSAHSQTSRITVYGFYLQESPIHLTIIDTPGYGATRGYKNDQEISMSLLSLSNFTDWLHEIHAVCLVIDASQTRLSDRQIYIFDAVQSLFGRDIAENIVLLLTHSSGTHPKNALTAVKEANIKCAVNDENQPVYFVFNNRQSNNADEECDEEYEMIQEQTWQLSFRGMAGLFMFVDTKKPRSLQITQEALQKWKQLEAKISKLQSNVQEMGLKQNELKTLKEKTNIERQMYAAEVPKEKKEKIDTDPTIAKMAMCCVDCEENCLYSDTWWDRLFNFPIKDDHCTVCKGKCHYSKHVKEAKIYPPKTKKEEGTFENFEKEYDDDRIGKCVSLVKKLEVDLKELEKEKIKVVMDAYHCVDALQIIAFNVVPLITLQHIDFLIEILKEINELDKAEVLENIKKRAGREK